jgi:hypothetical protein
MLDGSQFLNEIRNRDPHLGKLLEDIIDGVNGVANHAGFDPTGKVQPPDPLAAINIAAGTDHVHVTLTDNSKIKKQANYFVEYSVNDPSFSNPHVEHLNASRGRVLALPAKDSNNAAISYYFKAYSQYPGSDAQSKHAFFGGRFTPTAVQLTGSSKLTLLPSPGSGTGLPDGSQSGSGLGKVLERPPAGPKRSPAPRRA